ncbi:DUF1850 domain-containing protein [Afipia sp. TerB]
MSVCFASAGVVKALSVAAFMLSWTHSVEKIEWQEDWVVTPKGLEIIAARVKGSGAGMEPPPEARLVNGWFQWTPKPLFLHEVALGNSGVAGEWRLCTQGSCRTLSDILGHPVGANVTLMSVCDKAEGTAAKPSEPPADPRALIQKGDDLKNAGDYARAIVAYSAAVAADLALAEAYNRRGEAWRANGDRRRALADFEAALKLDPQHEAARANRKSLATEIERVGAQMPLKQK